MDRDKFKFLVDNFNSLTQEETAELRAEQSQFGYCQVLRELVARGEADHSSESKDASLGLAAIFSTDRGVLKKVMTEPRAFRESGYVPNPFVNPQVEPFTETPSVEASIVTEADIEQPPKVVEPIAAQVQPKVEVPTIEVPKPKDEVKAVEPPAEVKSTPEPLVSSPVQDTNFDVDSALRQFEADLEPMRAMKRKFEEALAIFEVVKPEEKSKEKPKSSTKTKAAEKATALADPSAKAPEKPKRRGRPPASAKVPVGESLLQEISTSKKELEPESPKQKEQAVIIDEFIKTNPTISKPMATQTELDLTGSSDAYNENVVSETLAMILIKQGKKEKAIEVLRKLIWKFPQKKAYFAAQIEDLSK